MRAAWQAWKTAKHRGHLGHVIIDALSPGDRMVLPLTAAMGPAPIGKGPMVLLTRTDDPQRLTARVVGFVAIYSALGGRVAP